MDSKLRQLIFKAIDETISPAELERLQDALEQSEAVREEYVRAVSLSESLSEIATSETVVPQVPVDRGEAKRRLAFIQLGLAALVLFAVGSLAFWFGHHRGARQDQPLAEQPGNAEALIAGHATLRRAIDIQWSGDVHRYREGDVLPDGRLQFDAGVAEIDFFCGATLIVEGPATLQVKSDWSVEVLQGRLRANVPPAARGFTVNAAGTDIIDLGTEFALHVTAKQARVKVLDGEVEIRGGQHDGKHLLTGQGVSLNGTEARPDMFAGLSTEMDVRRRRESAADRCFTRWQSHSQQLYSDERLIAYYPIATTQPDRLIRNAAESVAGRDGLLVGPVERTEGRFGKQSTGLAFDRAGARVRTRIDGTFQALTFMCWARIDSLSHRYNALFMADGYENGEPHWQIRNDGRLMFSIMVDDTQDVRHFNQFDPHMVRDAGLHRVYFSEPIWDISKSGQWFHITAVFDPINRQVTQYVNGEQVSSEQILDQFHISQLRIGPAEIGNWGQPFRKTPWFAVRNLDGIIDELAIFNAALTADEIRSLYEQGKPPGY